MIKETEKFAASTLLEGMTSISALLNARALGVNDRPILEILADGAKRAKKRREFAFLERKCEELSIPFTILSENDIEKMSVGSTHGGILARCGERTLPLPTAHNLPSDGFLCYLDGVEDPYNFGYALRSLYAAGCDGVLLDERNWMSAAGVVARASAGASELLPMWAGDAEAAIAAARAKGYRVVCAGIRDSVSFLEADLKKPVLLVVGGEKRGISSKILQSADSIVRIDYGREFRGSLSAASATTVLAFEVLRQNK